MICTGISQSGAGTGMVHIQAKRRLIPRERLPAATGWYAVGVGSTMLRACVPRIGTATTTRAAGAASLVSGLCAPEFCSSSEGIEGATSAARAPASAGESAERVPPDAGADFEGAVAGAPEIKA